MGGRGSGRRDQDGKDTTSVYRALDVRQLQRDGLLLPGRYFGLSWRRNGAAVASIRLHTQADHVILTYRSRINGGDWQPMEYPVYLEWTDCNLGGKRAWFLCPARRCGRRVAILYGGAFFACRRCNQLVYPCQRETSDERQARRADKIRERLNWQPGILNGNGWKPKGMHWRTYERLKHEHNHLVSAALAGIAERLGLHEE
ncbi:MAG: uncharacterized protein H6R26_663 [Proteobacteria bacterium]|nr:uncharacterized protein [Pseudomonadota bacterium]